MKSYNICKISHDRRNAAILFFIYFMIIFQQKVKICQSQVYFLPWKQLTTSQREAAKCLGYKTKKAWNCNLSYNAVSYWWSDLPQEQKLCAVTLGFDERSWDLLPTPVYKYFWRDLTSDQQKAAKCIGYIGPYVWDSGVVIDVFITKWNNLSKEIKECAKVLQFEECSWDTFGE